MKFNFHCNSHQTLLQVTGSQLYGIDEKTQKALKSFSNGKLKTEYVNNEEYLPRLTLGEKINMVLTRLEPVEQSHWVSVLVIVFLKLFSYQDYLFTINLRNSTTDLPRVT